MFETKGCKECGADLPPPSPRGGHPRLYCSVRCSNKRHNRGAVKRKRNLKYQYGLDVDTVDAVGHCEVCETTERLVVDHCHTTGVVRGILCSNCNTALGMMRDNAKMILSLYEYARRFGE